MIENHEARIVLVMVKKSETLNIPSEGSTTCGLGTLRKLGGSIPNKRDPIGPEIKPTITRISIMIDTGKSTLIEQPVLMVYLLFDSLFLLCSFCSL